MTERRTRAPIWIATCGGLGYFPKIPGTAGAALGLGLTAGLDRLPVSRPLLTLLVGGTAAVLFAAGVWASNAAEKLSGRKDPSHVVIDEVVGQMISLMGDRGTAWTWLIAGFLLFRFFDIAKPFPARRAEKVPGGWGIMLDDVIAGIYSLVVLWVARSRLK